MRVGGTVQAKKGATEVRVAAAHKGNCATGLLILHGKKVARATLLAIMGHEMYGVSDRFAEVTDWPVGDTVTGMQLDWDETRPACLAGNSRMAFDEAAYKSDDGDGVALNRLTPGRQDKER